MNALNTHFLKKALLIFVLFSAFAEASPDSIRGTAMAAESLKKALARAAEYQVDKPKTDSVLVLGEVKHPGFHQPKEYNLLNAIGAAGGRTEFASKRRFYVLRADVLTAFRFSGEDTQSASFELKPGDTIFIEYLCTDFNSALDARRAPSPN